MGISIEIDSSGREGSGQCRGNPFKMIVRKGGDVLETDTGVSMVESVEATVG